MKTLLSLSLLSLPLLVVACAGSDPANDDTASEADNLTAGGGDCMTHSGIADDKPVDLKICGSDDVKKIGEAMTPQFRECYRAGLRENPRLQGKVVLTVEIDKNGKVTSVKPSSQQGLTDKVTSCLAGAMDGEQFVPMGGVDRVILHVPVILVLR